MTITFGDEQDDPLPASDLVRFAEFVLIEEGLSRDTVVSLTMVDEGTIAELNRAHMGKSGSTDVLSFPIEDAAPGRPPVPDDAGPPLELGDVFIAPAVVRANARRDGVAFDDEMLLMVVHGVLHLLGWDHVDDQDATAMEKREGELLSLISKVRP